MSDSDQNPANVSLPWGKIMAAERSQELDVRAMEDFLTHASHGRSGGASHGQQVAHRLVKALAEIGDDFCILDTEMLHAAGDVIRALGTPEAARIVLPAVKSAAKGTLTFAR